MLAHSQTQYSVTCRSLPCYLEDFGIHFLPKGSGMLVLVEPHDGLRDRERALPLPRRFVVLTLGFPDEQPS